MAREMLNRTSRLKMAEIHSISTVDIKSRSVYLLLFSRERMAVMYMRVYRTRNELRCQTGGKRGRINAANTTETARNEFQKVVVPTEILFIMIGLLIKITQ